MADDYELVQRSLRGDREALATLVESHLRQTYAVAFALTGSSSESEDLVQEAFLRAFGSLPRFRRDGRFAPWITKILRIAFADRRRRERRERRAREEWKRGVLSRERPELAMEIEREEAEAILKEAVRALPEGLRAPLLLYYIEDLDANRVAERLGLHPATARKRIQRARDRLRGDLVQKLGAAVPFLAPAAWMKDEILTAASSVSVLPGPGVPPVVGEGTGPAATLPAAWTAAATKALVVLLAISAVTAGFLLFSRGPSPSGRSSEESAALPAAGEGASVQTSPAAGPQSVGKAPDAGDATGLAVDISGSVIHAETKEPIAGARVLFYRDPSPATSRPIANMGTDANGCFRFDGSVPSDVVQLFPAVTKDGFQAHWVWHQGVDPRADHVLDPIRLWPGIEVRGLVLLPDRTPAGDGYVWSATDLKEGSTSYSGRSDLFPTQFGSDGRFTAWVSGARAAFLAYVPGFVSAWSAPVDLNDPDRQPVVIRVEAQPNTVLTGFVFDEDGVPIAAAEIGCSSSSDVRPGFDVPGLQGLADLAPEKSDAQGFFRIEGAPDYSTLRVTHPEYLGERLEGVVLDESPVRIILSRARWLSVRIEGPDGGPLPISVVELRPERGSSVKLHRRGETFRSPPLGPRAGRGKISISGYVDTKVEWPDGTGEHSLGTIRPDRGIVLTVKVIDAQGRPIEGASVERAFTDSRGEVRLWGLEAGTLHLRVSREGFATKEEEVHLTPKEVRHERVLDRGASLAARFVDPCGGPAHRVWMTLLDPSQGDPGPWFRWGTRAMWLPTGRTGMDGRVEIHGIPPGKPFHLGYLRLSSAPGLLDVEALAPGEVRDLGDIELEAGGTIRGVVEDEQGKPLHWAQVGLRWRDEDGAWWQSTALGGDIVTDANGLFQVSGLPAGLYRVGAVKLDHVQRHEMQVPLGRGETRDVEIVLSRAVTFAGRITYEDGSPLRRATIWLDHVGMPDRDDFRESVDRSGRFLFKELPADGPVRMTVVYGELPPLEIAEAPTAHHLPRLVRVPRGADLVVEVRTDELHEHVVQGLVKVSLRLPWRNEVSKALSDRQALFFDLPEGSERVSVEAGGFLPPEAQVVDLVAGTTQRIAFRLIAKETQSFTVRVTTPSGDPAAGAKVYFINRSGPPRFVGTTDDRGLLTLQWPDEAPKAIQAFKEGFAFRHETEALSRVSNSVLDLVLASESAFVIRVSDDRGIPIQTGIAQIQSLDGISVPDPVSFPKDIGGGGIVRLGCLAPGRYRIAFGASGSEWGEMEASIGVGEERSLSFRVPPSFEVTGRVFRNGRLVTGGRIGFVLGDMQRDVPVDTDGSYTIPLRKAGKYRITYSSTDGNERFEQTLEREIAGAGTLDLEF